MYFYVRFYVIWTFFFLVQPYYLFLIYFDINTFFTLKHFKNIFKNLC